MLAFFIKNPQLPISESYRVSRPVETILSCCLENLDQPEIRKKKRNTYQKLS